MLYKQVKKVYGCTNHHRSVTLWRPVPWPRMLHFAMSALPLLERFTGKGRGEAQCSRPCNLGRRSNGKTPDRPRAVVTATATRYAGRAGGLIQIFTLFPHIATYVIKAKFIGRQLLYWMCILLFPSYQAILLISSLPA